MKRAEIIRLLFAFVEAKRRRKDKKRSDERIKLKSKYKKKTLNIESD